MPRIRLQGPLRLRLSGLMALSRIAMSTYVRRLFGRRLEPSWNADLEIGARFWRRQFTRAMTATDMSEGRAILDCIQTETLDDYEVDYRAEDHASGAWYIPRKRSSPATLLYLHGGGYAFHGAMSRRYAMMLAHRVGAPVFAPDYRLTPEHPHPAQAEDALAAWRLVTDREAPRRIVVVGDSAGGHMMLMLLRQLKDKGLTQPALGIGLCPWTDIGDRGASLHGNDRYDLVQGWMALRFGQWLDPENHFGRTALSPMSHDYTGLAPLYLQAGGREILRDMIFDFATAQANRGADVVLDEWPSMPHDFQLFDSTERAATEAIERIKAAIGWAVDGGPPVQTSERTTVAAGRFRSSAPQ